jgi:hypothetical protein
MRISMIYLFAMVLGYITTGVALVYYVTLDYSLQGFILYAILGILAVIMNVMRDNLLLKEYSLK